MPSASPRGRAAWVPLLASAVVLVALLATAMYLVVAGSGSAHASEPQLTFDLSCSPEQTVGGAVAFKYTLTNTGDQALTKVSVIDDRLGDVSVHFPGSLNPSESAEVIRYYIVQESDPRPFTNSATATYDPAPAVTDSCTVDVPHLTLTKTATVIDTSTIFTFVITNDGSTFLHRFKVMDSSLGDLTDQFPLFLAPGETVVVEITVPRIEPCDNTVLAQYESVPRNLFVLARAECGEGGGPDFTASKECFPKTGDVGDPINVKVDVLNIGTDPLTNVSATDDHAGALSFSGGDGNNNNLLDPGETWVFTGSYDPGIAGSFTNQAEVQATTLSNILLIRLTNTDTCVRTEPPNGDGTFPTDTDCGTFNDGSATPLNEIEYSLSRGNIHRNVTPGVFFYFSEFTIGSAGILSIVQGEDEISGLEYRFRVHKDFAKLFDGDCNPIGDLTVGANDIDVTGPLAPGTYIVQIKYDSKSLAGFPEPDPTTVHYTFQSCVGATAVTDVGCGSATLVDQDSNGLNLVPKP